MNIKIKRLSPITKTPTRGSVDAAGYDLYACINEPIEISSYSCQKIDTGISIEIPKGYFGAIYARSGLAIKESLRPANCVGVIDADYRGPVMVALHNDSGSPKTVNPGDRIAQLIIHKFEPIDFIEADNLEETDRGDGGFGSTGK